MGIELGVFFCFFLVIAVAMQFFASADLANHDEAKKFPPWSTSTTQAKCVTILSIPYHSIHNFLLHQWD